MTPQDKPVFFPAGSFEDQVQGIANLLPNDRPFYAKNISGTNLRKLLQGLAYEIWRVERQIETISLEHDINFTVSLISEWESALGIPDDCFSNTGTIEERRKNVITKLRARGVATKEDFIALAFYLGYSIEIIDSADVAYPPYDVPFFPVSLPQGRFVWYIKGYNIAPFVPPYDVPFIPNNIESIISCFFQKLKPANTILYIVNITP